MLGRSSEGAWIELGIRLADAVERESTKEAAKIRQAQQDIFIRIRKEDYANSPRL